MQAEVCVCVYTFHQCVQSFMCIILHHTWLFFGMSVLVCQRSLIVREGKRTVMRHRPCQMGSYKPCALSFITYRLSQ